MRSGKKRLAQFKKTAHIIMWQVVLEPVKQWMIIYKLLKGGSYYRKCYVTLRIAIYQYIYSIKHCRFLFCRHLLVCNQLFMKMESLGQQKHLPNWAFLLLRVLLPLYRWNKLLKRWAMHRNGFNYIGVKTLI